MSKFKIWNRDLNLRILYECNENEEPLEKQEETLKEFIKIIPKEKVLINDTKIKEFCINEDGKRFPEKRIDNIFKYVMPKSIFVLRNSAKNKVIIECDYKYNTENNINIVFENNKFVRICFDE